MTDHEEAPSPSEPHLREPADLGDADLVLRARSGDTRAYGELWRRHYRSGIVVARNVSPGTDADDLVQEAYTRIYQSIQRGGGPTGSFRAYLFTSIRNTAAGWARSRHETTIDELETLEDPATSEQATSDALDRGLTHQAFRSLPSRWQEVLWYSEIEGMKPAEIAPLLGLKPTAVAQLTFRAREGLREAWIQAHLRSVADDSDCAWTIERLGAYARNNIGRRDRARVEAHLAACARCAIVASEAHEVSGRLTFVLIPLTVGVAGTAGYLASVQGGGVPIVALAAMPSSVVQGAVSAGSGLGVGASGTLASAASSAGSGSGVAAGSTAAAGAGAASAASTAGAAVGTAAAGTAAAATGAAVAAGGAMTTVGVAGFAAATLVVAGTVVAAVALPIDAEQSKPALVRSLSDPGTTGPAESISDDASLAPEGPSPADIPVLPADAASDENAGEDGGEHAADGPASAADTASADGGGSDPEADDAGAGSAKTGGNGNGNGNGQTGGNGSTDTGTVDTGADGNAGNGNTGGGDGLSGENNGTPQSGNDNSGAGNNNGIRPAELPGGSPAIESSSSSQSSGQTTIVVVASGAPGATVQARIRGTVVAAEALGSDGLATLQVQPSAQDLSMDARLELRYVSGDVMGIPVSARLSALL